MPEWRQATVESLVARVTSGGTPTAGSGRFYGKPGTPFIKIEDLSHSEDRFIRCTKERITAAGLAASSAEVFPAGTIAVSMYGTMGLVKTLADPMATNQAMAALVPPFECDPDYLAHAMRRQGPLLQRFASQTTQPNLSLDIIRNVTLHMPPAAEQRRIAEVLNAIDDTIRATESVIAKRSTLRDAIRSDLLVRLDNAEHMPLRSLATAITSGSRGWAQYYSDAGRVFLRIGNLTREHPNLRRLDHIQFVHPPANAEEERTRCVPGDLLVSITADLGVIGVVPDGLGPSYVNQHIARLSIDPRLAEVRFVAHVLQSPLGQSQFRALDDPGAKAGLNLPTVGDIVVPLPSLAEQHRVTACVDDAQSAVDQFMTYLKKLRETRAGLANDLLTGRVRVPA